MIWPFKRNKRRAKVEFTVTPSQDHLSRLDDRSPVLDRHFTLLEQLQNTYTPTSEKSIEKSIKICNELMAISEQAKNEWFRTMVADAERRQELGFGNGEVGNLPYHPGYKQLAIIYEKRGDFENAIQVAQQAHAQGWNGDWEKRIARCESKIAKLKPIP